MIRSMTGYARSEAQGPWGRLSWEIRSVNHRYLELQFRLPEEFRGLEGELRTRATSRIGRGKVEASLRFVNEGAAAAALDIDTARLDAVCAALAAVSARTGGDASTPDPLRLLAWPGVVRQETTDLAPLHAAALTLFDQVLKTFTEARGREGERLGSHIEERARTLETLAARVRERAPQVRAAWLEKLQTRLRELAVEIEPARLAQEAALSAQRLDVDEELSRLASHLVEVRSSLKSDEAIGRRLDFLMQELNRETNTLSSKSQDAEMTRCAVEMKVAIEQMREQVQNIE
jgi:uncharacterized protein (TIGR00255 family)